MVSKQHVTDEEFSVDKNEIIYDWTTDVESEGLGSTIFNAMRTYGAKVAQYLADSNEIDTYDDLLRRCTRVALNMQLDGFTKDDIICLCSDNHKNSCVPLIASLFLGIPIASPDPALSASESSRLLAQINPCVIFVSWSAMSMIEEALKISGLVTKIVAFGSMEPDRMMPTYKSFQSYVEWNDMQMEADFKPIKVSNLNDTALILFSSGTTGLPKGICLSHLTLEAQHRGTIYYKTRNNLVYLSFTSLYWISAVGVLIESVTRCGARLVCKQFVASQYFDLLEKYKVTVAHLSPVMAIEVCKSELPRNHDFSSFKVLLTGGGSISAFVISTLRSIFPNTFVTIGYGQTEVAGFITGFREQVAIDRYYSHSKLVSCGRPLPGKRYKVADLETGRSLGPNERGELRLKSQFIMTGYYKKDSSMTFDENGWLRTGDVVYYDSDYCFYVVDRIKEMFKYRSWHVTPAAIESILLAHPAVEIAAVVGKPHDEDGDHPTAIVVVRTEYEQMGHIAEAIRHYVDERVSDKEKLRGGVHIVKSLPKTNTGKIRRWQLRQMLVAN